MRLLLLGLQHSLSPLLFLGDFAKMILCEATYVYIHIYIYIYIHTSLPRTSPGEVPKSGIGGGDNLLGSYTYIYIYIYIYNKT